MFDRKPPVSSMASASPHIITVIKVNRNFLDIAFIALSFYAAPKMGSGL
jgi:hypothetical protein